MLLNARIRIAAGAFVAATGPDSDAERDATGLL
jgi:hypothetical protein